MKGTQIKRYMVLTVLLVLLSVSACGKSGKNDTNMKVYSESSVLMESESKVGEVAPDLAQTEEISEKLPTEEIESAEIRTSTISAASSDQESLENREDKAAYLYKDILDMYYQKISYGWDRTEDVSLIFFQGYFRTETVSDVGYAFVDLDNNGVPELLISTVQDAVDGMLYDLYSYVDGNVVHLASSIERDRYYLCEDNKICNEGSGGAAVSSTGLFGISSDKHSLSLKEIVVYNADLNQKNPWFYGKEECYDSIYGYDSDYLIGITEKEARNIQSNYKKKNIELTLFDSYALQGDISDEVKLKQTFKEAIGSETIGHFWCNDFDDNGTIEAFGVTGNSDGWSLNDSKIYFVNENCEVFCIDEIEKLYGFGEDSSWDDSYTILKVDNIQFVDLGGYDGQKTFLYSVKGDLAYQPQVSGKHASFRKLENGLYIGEPHEGGTEERECYYNFNFDTGEFDQVDYEAEGE